MWFDFYVLSIRCKVSGYFLYEVYMDSSVLL